MNYQKKLGIFWTSRRISQSYVVTFTVAALLLPTSTISAENKPAQAGGMESEHEHATQPKTLSEQIGDLSRQVSELQSKISEQGVDGAMMKVNGDEYRSKLSMGMLNAAPQPMPLNAQSAATVQAPQVDMMAGMMSMMNSMMGSMGSAPMGQATSLGTSSAISGLPGFPGASHLYHIGSTNFFLDHPQHITLSLDQQSRLGRIRTNALLRRSDFNRKIQEVEEQLWLLTASDQPNLANIEMKIRESEKLKGDSRLAYIKDVGEAAMLLSNEQRSKLLGQVSLPAQSAPVTMPGSQVMGDM